MTAACCPTCKRRLPAPRKPKMDANLKAFLAIKFPANVQVRAWTYSDESNVTPEARAQFAYGTTKRRAKDEAVLYAARAH